MPLKFTTGDIFDSQTQAIVNPVNTVGVMGKGLALAFKKAFPKNFKLYKEACDEGLVNTGKMYVTETNGDSSFKWIINFPTKEHWRGKSQFVWIENGLIDLRKVLVTHKMRSIALPAIGCGLGGLQWNDVKNLIVEALDDLEDVEILIFEPK